MAFKFVVFLATLAFANAGLIAHQEPQYYSADQHHYQPAVHSYAAPAATSYSKQTSYSAPKTVIAQQAIAYHQPQVAYHAQPALAYAQPLAKTVSTYTSAPAISHGHYGYEHGQSEQNIVRSAHGTVAHHSKSVITPHSSVSKYDTRITNDYASPSYAYSHQPALKTVAYAAPAIQQYSAPAIQHYSAPAIQHYSAPATQHYSAPAIHSYAAPAIQHHTSVVAPAVHTYAAPQIHHAAPAVHSYASPAVHSYASPAVHSYAAPAQYAHASPVLAAKSVHFSPSVAVSHTSFEGPNAHYAW